MASNIPLRRTTRASALAAQNVNENATAGLGARATTRSKAKGLQGAAATIPAERATASTLASRSKARAVAEPGAGKRKREALAEVTATMENGRGKRKGKAGQENGKKGEVKEPAKEQHVEMKAKPLINGGPVFSKPRQPLRAVDVDVPNVPVRRVTRSSIGAAVLVPPLEQVAEEVVAVQQEEVTMAVDDQPAPSAHHSAVQIGRRRSIRLVGASLENAHDDSEARRVFKKRHVEEGHAEESRGLADDSQLEVDVVAAELATEEWAQEELAEESAPGAEPEEADPDGDLWFDLDAEDEDDPVMVSEYVVETYEYLKELEQLTLPDASYITSQPELTWRNRGTLVDWLIQVHTHCRLLPETLFLTTNLLDRFLSLRAVSLAKVQLVGLTCFLIASKFEETFAPSIEMLITFAGGVYTEDELRKAERFVLKTLDWGLGLYPNAVGWLRRVSKADDFEIKARTLGKYLMEIGIVEWRLVGTTPSVLAAAAMWLARLALGRGEWTPNLAHYSTYRESELLPTANIMVNYILMPVQHEALHKKYAGKRMLKSSLFMKQWVTSRWKEGSRAELKEDLPTLKAMAREGASEG